MASVNAEITYKKNRKVHQTTGQRLIFSPNRCFSLNGDREDLFCLNLLAQSLRSKSGVAIAGDGEFADYFLNQRPEFKSVPRLRKGDTLPAGVRHVFIAETLTVPRMAWRKKLAEQKVEVSDPMVLVDLDGKRVDADAFNPRTVGSLSEVIIGNTQPYNRLVDVQMEGRRKLRFSVEPDIYQDAARAIERQFKRAVIARREYNLDFPGKYRL
jgi:hypothetical protein